MIRVRRLVRPDGACCEVTWDRAEVEVWTRLDGVERIARHPASDPDRADSLARAAVARHLADGFAEGPADRESPVRSGRAYDRFVALVRARSPEIEAVRPRVHRELFAPLPAEWVGAAWEGAFVTDLRLRPVDPPALAAALGRAGCRTLRSLALDLRAARVLEPTESGSAEVLRPAVPVQAAVDALIDAPPPRTLRALALRADDGALDLEGLAALGLEALRLELPIPVDEAFALARPLGGRLQALHLVGRRADPESIAEALEDGAFPALRQLWVEPGADRIRAAAYERELTVREWTSPAPLEGLVAWDGGLPGDAGAAPPLLGYDLDDGVSGASGASVASGDDEGGPREDWGVDGSDEETVDDPRGWRPLDDWFGWLRPTEGFGLDPDDDDDQDPFEPWWDPRVDAEAGE